MWTKFAFIAGVGIGYVLGTRAGREQYDALKSQADALLHDPRVQEKVSAAGQTVKEKAPEVQSKIADAASHAGAAAKGKLSRAEGESAAEGKSAAADSPTGSGQVNSYTPVETTFDSAPPAPPAP